MYDQVSVGGSKKLRPYWQTFYKHADIVIYVIDAHNYQRIGEADKILRALLKDDQLKTIPFIVVANKQVRLQTKQLFKWPF